MDDDLLKQIIANQKIFINDQRALIVIATSQLGIMISQLNNEPVDSDEIAKQLEDTLSKFGLVD